MSTFIPHLWYCRRSIAYCPLMYFVNMYVATFDKKGLVDWSSNENGCCSLIGALIICPWWSLVFLSSSSPSSSSPSSPSSAPSSPPWSPAHGQARCSLRSRPTLDLLLPHPSLSLLSRLWKTRNRFFLRRWVSYSLNHSKLLRQRPIRVKTSLHSKLFNWHQGEVKNVFCLVFGRER